MPAANASSPPAGRLRAGWPRLALWAGLGTATLALGATTNFAQTHALMINASPSLPHWAIWLDRSAVPARGDLILFDPFSPEANPTLWSVDFLRALRRHTNDEGGMLISSTSSMPARLSMLLAGYNVGQGVATSTRTETTVATTTVEALALPLGDRWFARWLRSSSRAPIGEPFTEAIEQTLREHVQFANVVRPKPPSPDDAR